MKRRAWLPWAAFAAAVVTVFVVVKDRKARWTVLALCAAAFLVLNVSGALSATTAGRMRRRGALAIIPPSQTPSMGPLKELKNLVGKSSEIVRRLPASFWQTVTTVNQGNARAEVYDHLGMLAASISKIADGSVNIPSGYFIPTGSLAHAAVLMREMQKTEVYNTNKNEAELIVLCAILVENFSVQMALTLMYDTMPSELKRAEKLIQLARTTDPPFNESESKYLYRRAEFVCYEFVKKTVSDASGVPMYTNLGLAQEMDNANLTEDYQKSDGDSETRCKDREPLNVNDCMNRALAAFALAQEVWSLAGRRTKQHVKTRNASADTLIQNFESCGDYGSVESVARSIVMDESVYLNPMSDWNRPAITLDPQIIAALIISINQIVPQNVMRDGMSQLNDRVAVSDNPKLALKKLGIKGWVVNALLLSSALRPYIEPVTPSTTTATVALGGAGLGLGGAAIANVDFDLSSVFMGLSNSEVVEILKQNFPPRPPGQPVIPSGDVIGSASPQGQSGTSSGDVFYGPIAPGVNPDAYGDVFEYFQEGVQRLTPDQRKTLFQRMYENPYVRALYDTTMEIGDRQFQKFVQDYMLDLALDPEVFDQMTDWVGDNVNVFAPGYGEVVNHGADLLYNTIRVLRPYVPSYGTYRFFHPAGNPPGP